MSPTQRVTPEPSALWPNRQRRADDRELKREAVLRAAVELFNTRGVSGTSIEDVAAALHVTKPTVYHYFANKDDILFECVRRGVEAIHEAAAAAEKRGGNGMERLHAHLEGYARVMTSDFGMCVSRTADHELSEESRRRFRAGKRETDATLRRVIREGMEDGSIAPGDVRLAAFTVAGALNWIAHWYHPEGEMSTEEIATETVRLLVNGLAPRGGA